MHCDGGVDCVPIESVCDVCLFDLFEQHCVNLLRVRLSCRQAGAPFALCTTCPPFDLSSFHALCPVSCGTVGCWLHDATAYPVGGGGGC